MRTKTKKTKEKVPLDPVLLAATVPARKPTPKDLEDCKEDKDDAIEPQEYESMVEIAAEVG
ncbi:MAG: hypothetical protein NTW87_26800 [Planctomycetota bacterium]|nr:hypothetical protein [Planctomycetota bacterium]